MREVEFSIEKWPFVEPFVITGHTFNDSSVLHVRISEDGHTGCGEAAGVYYLDESAESMMNQALQVKAAIESGCTRHELLKLLPAGGARNAIDCALWDLEAKMAGQSIWALTGIEQGDVLTVNTLSIDSPEIMAQKAQNLDTKQIKIKLDAELPLERLFAIRRARPDAKLVVDVNQGWSFEQLVDLAPKFKELGVVMIEQPLQRGADELLESYVSPVPLCADESCLDTNEFAQAAKRYQMINIKLDKTGGLTEALELAKLASSHGLGLMVGNMLGTSLAMAPAFVVAQLCDLVDLDGPLVLKADRQPSLSYTNGIVSGLSPELWG